MVYRRSDFAMLPRPRNIEVIPKKYDILVVLVVGLLAMGLFVIGLCCHTSLAENEFVREQTELAQQKQDIRKRHDCVNSGKPFRECVAIYPPKE